MTRNGFRGFSGFVALAILLSVSLGCSQLAKLRRTRSDSNTANSGPDFPTPSKQASPGQTKAGLDQKAQLYITKCFNPYANSVMSSYQRYTSWIKDVDNGPTGKEMNIYGLYEIRGDGEDCSAAVKEANAMEPHIADAEQDAEEFSNALKAAISQVNNVYKYYDQGDYKDDNFQKGKQSHTALMEAFKKFETVNKKFAADLDDMENQVAEVRLAELKDDPAKKFEFTVVSFNIKAKKISSYAQHTKYEDMSADELQTMSDELESAISAMKGSGSGNSMASMYFNAADELLKASKELMRHIRDHKPFSSIEKSEMGTSAGWMVDGSPDKVIYAYNQLLSRRSLLRIGS